MKQMNYLILSLILILNCSLINSNDDIIKHVFEEFQTALINKDCDKIFELSEFPIKGDTGLARLINSEEPRDQMELNNYQISKELLIQNCTFLDSIELEVLTKFDFSSNENEGVKYNDCIYKANIYVAEDNSFFQFSIGCVKLINQSIGEYSMIFTFNLINGKYKLTRIHGAG